MRQKFGIVPQDDDEETRNLLLLATSRLVGHEPEQDPTFAKSCFIRHQDNMDQLILLDDEQQSIIDMIDEFQHFAIDGGHGSGKTVVDIHLVNTLIDKCRRE